MKDSRPEESPSEKRGAPEDEDTRDESYAAVWQRLKRRTPELIGRARQRRENVERLDRELMQAEPARQLRMVREPRFQSLDLLDRLLEQSHERQLSEPSLAARLARLALRLGTGLKENRTEAAMALPRAFCLNANALRLDSRLSAADALLARGSLFLADSLERAFYCRTLAVLRWEQARTDEAQALLEHAVRLYSRDGLNGDAALGRILLGLVRLETGDGDALPALHRGWPEMDRAAHPLASLRGGLALAASLARAGQGDRARNVLRQTWGLYARVTDPREMHRVFWWEGRALASLGDHEEAMDLLESVRRQLLAEPDPAEAALVSVDLARVMVESHRAAGIEMLAEELKSAFPGVQVLALAAEGIRSLVHLERPGESPLREAGSAVEITLRRAFRVCGLGIRPFPVV
jgi:tetratricopeptide (TPR) repeat protein